MDYERKTFQLEKNAIEKEALVMSKESEIGQIKYLKNKLENRSGYLHEKIEELNKLNILKDKDLKHQQQIHKELSTKH